MAQPEHAYTVLARQFPPRSDLDWQVRQRERTPTVTPPLVVSVPLVSAAPLRSSDAAWLRLSLPRVPSLVSRNIRQSASAAGVGSDVIDDNPLPGFYAHAHGTAPSCQCPGSRLSRVGSLAPNSRCRIAASSATECGHRQARSTAERSRCTICLAGPARSFRWLRSALCADA
jgi:hypothetical protein